MSAKSSDNINIVDLCQTLRKEFEQNYVKLKANSDSRAIEELRINFLGRKGKIASVFESLKNVAPADRPTAGQAVNSLRKEIEDAIKELQQASSQADLEKFLQKDPLDITLPTRSTESSGSLHPVTLMRQDLLNEFRRLGFTVYDGPEIDFDFYNFSALNFPEYHPARDMHDTFFVKSEGKDSLLLRTHTSNIQIHAMLNEKPPLRVVAPGRTFRCDSDLTHTPMFHQIEAFVVDQNISFAHMKGVIDRFLKAIYGNDINTRLRPSYFPFVEPGAEVDMQCVACRGKGCRICKNTGWLEIGGCGMIHPNVFEAIGYDSEIYSGFAFGFGIDRMAMLKYSLPDLRQLFSGDRDFLSQFPIFS